MRRIEMYAATALLAATVAVSPGPLPARAEQDGPRVYEVTIINMAAGQLLSPPLVATHTQDLRVFAVGDAAREGIRVIAEEGRNTALAAELSDDPDIGAVVAAETPVHRVGGPGSSSMTLMVESRGAADRLSAAMMVGCTNDGFTGLSSVELSRSFVAVDYYAAAYDAGTEANDQLYAHIPDGCAALGPVPVAADGMNLRTANNDPITMHPGIVPNEGDLTAAYAWGEPIVKISVRRVE